MSERAGAQHAPIGEFDVDKGELLVGGIPLSLLAARVGRTPFYAYDRGVVSRRVAAIRSVIPESLRLHYAMKANPMPAMVAHLVREVDGIDVASGGELRAALDAGARPNEISFAGPGKSIDELNQAVASGILVNVESARELDPIARAADRFGLAARVAIRVNPDFELKMSGMRMGGGPKQFGVDAEEVPALLRRVGSMGLTFEGFHLFSGSQSLQADAIVDAQRQSFNLARRLSDHAPNPPRVINLGGGFGIPYFPGDQPLDLPAVGAGLHQMVEDCAEALKGTELAIELGRYLVGPAGIYVCRVLDRKTSRGEVYLVTDGGLHHHLAASGNFGQVLRKNYPVTIGNRADSPLRERVNVVGPLCTPLDLLAHQMEIPAAQIDDLFVIFQSGAYGATASPQGFLSHPAVVEVLV